MTWALVVIMLVAGGEQRVTLFFTTENNCTFAQDAITEGKGSLPLIFPRVAEDCKLIKV